MSKRFTLAGLLALSAGVSYAQHDTTDYSVNLEETVITVSKIPLPSRSTAKPTRIIGPDEIARNQGKDLAQLLEAQTGISVNGANSNPGKDKSIFLRGASSAYLLILVDGIPVNDPSGIGSHFDIRLLPLEQIERIEILPGSQSALYGSDAMGGVINIITKKASKKGVGLSGGASFGSFNSSSANVNVSGSHKKFDYVVGYQYDFTEGISEALDTTSEQSFDKDGFIRHSSQIKLGYQPVKNLRIQPFIRWSDFDGNYDAGAYSDAPNTYSSTFLNPGLRANYKRKDLSIILGYNYNKTDRTYRNAYGDSFYKGRSHQTDLLVSHPIGKHLILSGGLYVQQTQMLDTNATVKNPENSVISPYVSGILKGWKNFNVEVDYRLTNHSAYGNNSLFTFAPAYYITDNLKAFASYGTGFKAPSLSNLYGQWGPNENLKPQRSQTLEGGLRYKTSGQRSIELQATVFKRKVKDVIIYTFSNGYLNQDLQHDHGLELDATFNPTDNIQIRGGYAYVTGEVSTKNALEADTSYYNLIRRPKHSWSLGVRYQPSKLVEFSVNTRYIGDRTDYAYNPVTFSNDEVQLDAYFLLDVYAQYRVKDSGLVLFGQLNNLLGQTIIEANGYTGLGTTAKLGLRFDL